MATKTAISIEEQLINNGIKAAAIHYNTSPEELTEISINNKLGAISSLGALNVQTGEFTGRSPKDRFIVKDEITTDTVWWDGTINLPFDTAKFDALHQKVLKHLSGKELYVRDAAAGADARYRMNLRLITELPWVSMFAYNMFLRLSNEELEDFSPEWNILQAPSFFANPKEDGTRQHNFSIINFSKKIILIGGSGYTGEVKKGVFSVLNFVLPTFKNVLPMHCSANVGKNDDTAIFFGLSGTGKTTLSADPTRKLIGDDEHGWTTDNVIFNFEGGCYAKVIDLSAEKEPDIYKAIKKGALLENVIYKEGTTEPDFEDTSITQNTRVSYPINYINNIQASSKGGNPKNIFFLTADAFGVLPPISKLSPSQAAYHFISGYTAKVAGTEAGVDEPLPSFSACFGAPFMPLHPTVYAKMLSAKMQEANVNVWLVNTGWTGGSYGAGSRMKLKYTRAMVTAALQGKLDNAVFVKDAIFGLEVPQACPNVPATLLNPRNTWEDKAAYDAKAQELAKSFHKNFKTFEAQADASILNGAPLVK
jgi:phosphoenolpyruvate carboxykinase (ATP)